MNEVSKLIQLNELGDHRGFLTVIEGNTTIPFDIKRVFYIYGSKLEVRRGSHAHFKTRQALICVSGHCEVSLDNLIRKENILLDSPVKVLLLEANDWHDMYNFSADCVLLVLASHHYDPQDYIHDYNIFVEIYRKGEIK
ncbi:MAG: WxcM domain protein [Bacilli bacterium]|nr:WxcM domain protein [Bacilli bacterium]